MKRILIIIVAIIGIINYSQGKTTETAINPEEAKLQCEKNSDKGCFNYGMVKILEREYNQAEIYFKKSCDLGYGGGCFKYGQLLDMNMKTRKELEKVLAVYTRSCDLYTLNGCQRYDEIMKNNHQTEKRFWQRICDNGNSHACEQLKKF